MNAKQAAGGIIFTGILFWLFSIWMTSLEQGTFLWSSSPTIRALSSVYLLSGLSIGIYRLVLNRRLGFRAAVGVSIISTLPPLIFRSQEIFEDYANVTSVFEIQYVLALYDSAVFLVPATTALGIALSRAQTTTERVIGVCMLLFPSVTYLLSTLDTATFLFLGYILTIVIVVGGFLLGTPLYFMIGRLDGDPTLLDNIVPS